MHEAVLCAPNTGKHTVTHTNTSAVPPLEALGDKDWSSATKSGAAQTYTQTNHTHHQCLLLRLWATQIGHQPRRVAQHRHIHRLNTHTPSVPPPEALGDTDWSSATQSGAAQTYTQTNHTHHQCLLLRLWATQIGHQPRRVAQHRHTHRLNKHTHTISASSSGLGDTGWSSATKSGAA